MVTYSKDGFIVTRTSYQVDNKSPASKSVHQPARCDCRVPAGVIDGRFAQGVVVVQNSGRPKILGCGCVLAGSLDIEYTMTE